MSVASAQHARSGRDGGFAQLGHGKHMAVKSLRRGDWIVYYSPRDGMGEGDTVQAFTTIGRVKSDAPYRAKQAMDFNPYRVDVDYLTDAKPAPIKPLLNDLLLTRDRVSWSIVMRGPKRKLEEKTCGELPKQWAFWRILRIYRTDITPAWESNGSGLPDAVQPSTRHAANERIHPTTGTVRRAIFGTYPA